MMFLGSLCLILLVTKLAGHFCNRIGVPAVIGELLVGIVIGPAMLGWIQPDEFIHYFSEIGVIILMFIAGLESDLKLLQKYWKPALSVALLGILFPLALGFFCGEIFNLGFQSSIFLGVLFSATSVSISVQVLKDLKKVDTKEGATILGAAVVDDIVVVILLGILVSVFHTNGGTEEPFVESLLRKVVFFIVVFAVSKWVIPILMKIANKLLMIEAVVTMALIICLAFAYFADYMGMGAIIGAFFAGIALSQTKYKHTIEQKIEPIGYAVFIPVFFVSIGLNMDFSGIGKQWIFILVLTVVAVLTKLIGGAFGAKLTGFNWKSAAVIGAGMVSRGEMALIIGKLGLESNLLSESYYSAIIVVIIATTVIAPFLLKYTIVKQDESLLK
ncbi:cation:proton antiporter [Carnobacterium gallinarum]|uniref:cation:proton antiporter n=1 Tax=Carnobacterium gallinarum TaxID=2749 RepID=UPI00054EF133|nr:cation:proton antiporter [Carnobacterium gallinarum]